jgi:hypothetical protein
LIRGRTVPHLNLIGQYTAFPELKMMVMEQVCRSSH